MEPKRNFTIYTGSEYENPLHGGDECDYHLLGASSQKFYGTLTEALQKGRELARAREEEGDDFYRMYISFHYWVHDDDYDKFYDYDHDKYLGKKRVLFICHANVDRSPTAQRVVAELAPDVETRSAGLAKYAQTTVSKEIIL